MHRAADFERLKQFLTINLLALDEELANMPALVQEAAEITAEVIQNRDAAKRLLEETKAEISMKIRTRSDKKPPEVAISDETLLNKQVQTAGDELDAREADRNNWIGLVDALRVKSSSLKHISEMTVAGFLTPSAAYDKVLDEKRKQREARATK